MAVKNCNAYLPVYDRLPNVFVAASEERGAEREEMLTSATSARSNFLLRPADNLIDIT